LLKVWNLLDIELSGSCANIDLLESSRKRHYYYCRSKLPDTNRSRRRSCAACVCAKTRCIVPDDGSSEACLRCRERNAECEFAVAPKSRTAHSGAKKSDAHGSTTSLALGRRSSLGLLTEHSWDAGFGDVDMSGFEVPLFGNQGFDSLLYPFSEQPSLVESGMSTLTPWDLYCPSLFEHRTFPRPDQAPLVSLAKQILRSYPFMMLQKAALPPFISRFQPSWAETEEGPSQQQSLITCIGLVQLFKSRTDSNRNLVWRLIKLEQERILSKVYSTCRCFESNSNCC
jgi:hypothetical protein